MRDKIESLFAAFLLTFHKLHEIQFNAPWNRGTGRC